jgi:hypothetical protein
VLEEELAADAAALVNYANAGGQLFLEHWQFPWIQMAAAWSSVASWSPASANIPTATASVDTSFARGQALQSWMSGIGALDGSGQFTEMPAKTSVQALDATKAQRWAFIPTAQAMGTSGVQIFSIPSATSCGRAIFSDMHESAAATAGTTFPAECPSTPLNPQQDALAFLFFDEQTCLQ